MVDLTGKKIRELVLLLFSVSVLLLVSREPRPYKASGRSGLSLPVYHFCIYSNILYFCTQLVSFKA